MSSSSAGKKDEANAATSLKELQSSIEVLVSYCKEHNLDIPETIRQEVNESLAKSSASLSGSIGGGSGRRTKRAKSEDDDPLHASVASHETYLTEQKAQRQTDNEGDLVQIFTKMKEEMKSELPVLDLRVKDGKFTVLNYFEKDPKDEEKEEEKQQQENSGDGSGSAAPATTAPERKYAKQKIQTVKTTNICYQLYYSIKRCIRNGGRIGKYSVEKTIIDKVNLYFEPGKMYLVIGGPGSGKSTLLRMIANNLSKTGTQSGSVTLSGVQPGKGIVWSSLVAYMNQIDRLHPYLTVLETCEFAWRCRTGGTHRRKWYGSGPEIDEKIAKADAELMEIHFVLDALGLSRVKDTFVGGQGKVRGVSGGEKKRVTIAEMLCVGVPVHCCDEISTGLDAATTYDITRLLGAATRVTKSIKIVSLLQPAPETVANFDEVIVCSEGQIVYSGPIDDVIAYFNELGYGIPERMDVADWLQTLPTSDGARFLKNTKPGKDGNDGDEEGGVAVLKHLSTNEFVEKFQASARGQEIMARLEAPLQDTATADFIRSIGSDKYKNSSYGSFKLLAYRELLLWWRDKYQIKAKIVQTIMIGILAGTLFWQAQDANSIIAILFQSMFYACVAQMGAITRQFPDRSIYYKQQDANFFPTWSYVLGRSIASIPIAVTDAIGYGTVIYFFVGLAYNDGATIANYFIFLLLLFTISLTTGLFFSMYPACVPVVTVSQALMALTAVLFILFCGFTVQPDVIPVYWIWFYWVNYFAWGLRGLAVNEFDSGKYDEIPPGSDLTKGEELLIQFGFTKNGEPFTNEWSWYGVAFLVLAALLSMVGSSILLRHIRFETGKSLVTDLGDNDMIDEVDEADTVQIPFTKVDLTFKNIRYTVMSSISNEELTLLKDVDGYIKAGKLTALMGSSGAGKTTLMDVLAMRKTTGEISGEICLNGHPQEELSFRRCTGYVEQFDLQSAQLTIRETVHFSAKLRLEETDPAVNDGSIDKFVDQTLAMLELTNLRDLQVGDDDTGGLSFEQTKRLSIAVELASNPSILFLDEPTSGLDARAAAIVMRGMRRVANSGRAVCATIHQPSVAIFNYFDSLLLLKRGGETVFFGELGEDSCKLIKYLESYEATPTIQPGENPATWMLTTIGAGSAGGVMKPFDYAGSYAESELHVSCLREIDTIVAGGSEKAAPSFPHKYATSTKTQSSSVMRRMMTLYYRCPSYNTVRQMICALVALLFASVYAANRVPSNESDMNSRINSIYIAVNILCVNSLNTVLKVTELERNMFYRHKACLMYDSRAAIKAFTLAEIPFTFLSATVYVMLFYFIMGFRVEASPFLYFYLFIFLTLTAFTFLGQMLVTLFKDTITAQGFGGLIVVSSSFFGGVLIRLSAIPMFWVFMYWLMPGHYINEGLIVSQYNGDNTPITATPGSAFYVSLGCGEDDDDCVGTAGGWVATYFAEWSASNLPWNALYLIGLLLVTRLITFYGLAYIDFRAN